MCSGLSLLGMGHGAVGQQLDRKKQARASGKGLDIKPPSGVLGVVCEENTETHMKTEGVVQK